MGGRYRPTPPSIFGSWARHAAKACHADHRFSRAAWCAAVRGGGSWDWPAAWALLGILGAGSIAVGLWLLRHDPALLRERMTLPAHGNQPRRDKLLLLGVGLLWCFWLFGMGRDAASPRFAGLPAWLQVLGALLFVGGYAVTTWTFAANSFASPAVRMQRNAATTSSTPAPTPWSATRCMPARCCSSSACRCCWARPLGLLGLPIGAAAAGAAHAVGGGGAAGRPARLRRLCRPRPPPLRAGPVVRLDRPRRGRAKVTSRLPRRGQREEEAMAERRIGIIMNGVTGRMGTNQHLVRSIAAIRAEGGVKLGQWRPADARPDPGRPQPRQAGGAGRARTASRASPPTSTPAWPTRRTSCSSTPRPRSSAPG